MHLHRGNDVTEEHKHGPSVECPFCGRREDSHTLMHNGYERGASARTKLTFEKGG